jgi:hypothetical protein
MVNVYLGLMVVFVIVYIITTPGDDDDGPDKGMMTPVYQGSR